MRMLLSWSLLGLISAGGLLATGCGSKDAATPTASIPGSDGASADRGQTDGRTAAGPHGGGNRANSDPLHPLVQFHTTMGDITVKLDAQHAPLTVDNFLGYVGEGYYDNTLLHQVYSKPLAVVLGGGYDMFGKEKATHSPIRNEAHNGLKNRRGTIGMARRPDSIDSSTAQFFVNLSDNPDLDHKKSDTAGYGYCVFGEVVSGMDVCDQIGRVAVHDTPKIPSAPVEPVAIKWVHVMR
jgi:peptidyl-prolyl cis-trans isomerase B (cyclophilin B)